MAARGPRRATAAVLYIAHGLTHVLLKYTSLGTQINTAPHTAVRHADTQLNATRVHRLWSDGQHVCHLRASQLYSRRACSRGSGKALVYMGLTPTRAPLWPSVAWRSIRFLCACGVRATKTSIQPSRFSRAARTRTVSVEAACGMTSPCGVRVGHFARAGSGARPQKEAPLLYNKPLYMS